MSPFPVYSVGSNIPSQNIISLLSPFPSHCWLTSAVLTILGVLSTSRLQTLYELSQVCMWPPWEVVHPNLKLEFTNPEVFGGQKSSSEVPHTFSRGKVGEGRCSLPWLWSYPQETESRQAGRECFSQAQMKYSRGAKLAALLLNLPAQFHMGKVVFDSLYPSIITMYYCQTQEEHDFEKTNCLQSYQVCPS